MATQNTAAAAKAAISKSKALNIKPDQNLKGQKSSSVAATFGLFRDQIAAALPKHMTPERMIQVVTTLVNRTPAIAECTFESIVGAMLTCSQLGLEPTPQLGLAYFVPFNNKGKKEVQFILGYRGMLALARRSGEILTTYAEVVYENDEFQYELGLDPKMTHRPAEGDRGGMTHVYAVTKYVNGGYNFIVMTKAEVEKIRKRSKASGSSFSPWSNADDYPAMAKKTAIRQLFKYAPTSTEHLAVANAVDGAVIDKAAFSSDGHIDLMEVPEADYSETDDDDFELTPPDGGGEEIDPATGEVIPNDI